MLLPRLTLLQRAPPPPTLLPFARTLLAFGGRASRTQRRQIALTPEPTDDSWRQAPCAGRTHASWPAAHVEAAEGVSSAAPPPHLRYAHTPTLKHPLFVSTTSPRARTWIGGSGPTRPAPPKRKRPLPNFHQNRPHPTSWPYPPSPPNPHPNPTQPCKLLVLATDSPHPHPGPSACRA